MKKLEVKGITACGDCPCFHESTCSHKDIGKTLEDDRDTWIIMDDELPVWCPLPEDEV